MTDTNDEAQNQTPKPAQHTDDAPPAQQAAAREEAATGTDPGGAKPDGDPPPPATVHPLVAQTKQLRKDIDGVIQKLRGDMTPSDVPNRQSRERSLSLTKLQEAVMWLGMDLKAMKDEGFPCESPYKESYNPSSPEIEPTADGLKL